jgi:hypothetical protein
VARADEREPGMVKAGRVLAGDPDRRAPDFRYGVADHARVSGAGPLFAAPSRLTESQARVSMDKVMWAYQAR